MLFADIHLKDSASGFDPVAEQARYERENTLLKQHSILLTDLQEAVSESNKSDEKMDQLREKNPMKLFVDCITKMMNPNPKKRYDALAAYNYLWLIYQLSKYPANHSENIHKATIKGLKKNHKE